MVNTSVARLSVWDSVCKQIREDSQYHSLLPWLHRLSFSSFSADESTVFLKTGSPELIDLFSDSIASSFSSVFESLLNHSVHIQITTPTPLNTINPHMQLDSFITGPGNRLAFAAAQSISNRPGIVYNPLYIYSDIGLGKTHILQSIYHVLRSLHSGYSVLYITGDTLTKVLQNNSFTVPDILLLDDVHLFSQAPSDQDNLFNLFSHLYHAKKQIVLASSVAPQSLSGFSDRIISRFRWGLVVEMEQPGSAMRSEIIRKKCAELSFSLPVSMQSYLAAHISGNIREIEGILHQLYSHASLLNQPVTMELVRKAISSNSTTTQHPVTLKQIQSFLCDNFRLSKDDLFSKSRARSISFPRQIGMYLAYSMTSSSLEEIGHYFGGRDHSTVKHGCEKVKRLSESDPAVRKIVDQFKKFVAESC